MRSEMEVSLRCTFVADERGAGGWGGGGAVVNLFPRTLSSSGLMGRVRCCEKVIFNGCWYNSHWARSAPQVISESIPTKGLQRTLGSRLLQVQRILCMHSLCSADFPNAMLSLCSQPLPSREFPWSSSLNRPSLSPGAAPFCEQ